MIKEPVIMMNMLNGNGYGIVAGVDILFTLSDLAGMLAYVYLPKGTILNEEIVKAGYANIMTVPPNVMYQERFLKAYREARENGRGLWK
jgi:hypothetical protein